MEKFKRLQTLFFIGIFFTLMFSAFEMPKGEATRRELSLGQIGGDVRQLQVALDKKGYDLAPFDGIYGLKTQQAVINLQKKHNLKPTGVYDDKTGKALYEVPRRLVGREGRAVRTVSRGVSRKDMVMLARVVHGEARGESFEGQVAVASVILNRTRSESFPGSIEGVIYQPRAFDAVSDGQIWLDPDQKSLKAAELALSGYDPTDGAIYYWNPAKTTNKWIWSRPIHKKIGEHVFAR